MIVTILSDVLIGQFKEQRTMYKLFRIYSFYNESSRNSEQCINYNSQPTCFTSTLFDDLDVTGVTMAGLAVVQRPVTTKHNVRSNRLKRSSIQSI